MAERTSASYPAYYVDSDLCLGVWSLNQAVLCVPASQVRHHKGASTTAPFRDFLLRHNRRHFLAKWGERLEVFEPRPGPAEFPEGLQRAVERAQDRWRCIQPAPHDIQPLTERPPFDEAAQERRVLEIALGLERAWTAELCARLERAAAERDAAAAERDLAVAAHRPALASAKSFLSKRIRRLRRRVAGVFRRFSRPAAASRTE